MNDVPGTQLGDGMTRRGWTVLFGLTFSQTLCAFGQMTMVVMSGIVGARLAPAPELVTLPVGAGVVGLAVAALPTALWIRRFGRRTVFTTMALWAGTGAVLSAVAITRGSFIGFCLGCFMLGNNMAAMAQYRFAVADCVPLDMISRTVSVLMLGTLTAALIAPTVALESRFLLDAEFAGTFIVLIVPFAIAACTIPWLPFPTSHAPPDANQTEGSLAGVLARTDIQLAIVAGAIGYGVMSVTMTAAPISMHIMDGFSVETTAHVIRAHMLAMYVPSFFSGWLVARIGVMRALWLGFALEAGAIVCAVAGQTEANYVAALILLGAGWNFLFVGGTTLLASACRDRFKYRVQGVNEMIMFGTLALGSLATGPLLAGLGWVGTNLAAGTLLVFVVIAILRDQLVSDTKLLR